MKRCSTCKKTKDDECFSKNKWRKDGLHHQCRECKRTTSKKYYSTHPDARGTRTSQGTWRERNRQWMVEYKAALSCEICGENHLACIEFHHRDETTKSFTIGHVFHTTKKQKVLEEISKCIVLCSNCHRKFHWELKSS
jgi:hypothetical protein